MNPREQAQRSEEPLGLWEALVALGALLPAVLLALPAPLSWLEGDPWPQYSAAALALGACLPMLCLLVVRRPARVPSAAWLVLLPILGAVLWRGFGPIDDQLEASRALQVLLASASAFLGTALLGPRGVRVLARGLCVVSLMLLLDPSNGPAGVLGNSGSLSQMALGGAAAGLWFVWRGSWPERVVGGATLGLFLAHAARTPVLAGSSALLLAIVALLLSRGGIRQLPMWREPVLAVAALLALSGLLAPLLRISDRTLPAPTEQAATSAPAASGGDVGGLAVRLSIWKDSAAMVLEHPWIGCGPGQFAAHFPPWRSVEEIERSSLRRTLPTETEVEHPHNDWVARALESGLPGLICLLLLGWLVLRSALFRESREGPLSLPALALLANSLVHGVLSYDAGSALVAFGVFGGLLSETATGAKARSVRIAGVLLIGAVALELPRAIAILRHGAALSTIGKEVSSVTLERAIEQALAACPDSVHARSLKARMQARAEDWLAVLEQRPDRFEAWMQLGNLRAKALDVAGARAAYDRALHLDPWHPGLLENRLTLLSRFGTLEETQRALADLGARKPVNPDWLASRARTAWLCGNESAARWLLQEAGAESWPEGPEAAYALARERSQAGDKLGADFLTSVAQRGFARAKAEQGRYREAARNYRQDWMITCDLIPGGAPRVRWEYGACLLAEGQRDEAEQLLAGLTPIADLPQWALKALESKP